MSEDQKPVAPAETTATSENASQPEQPVAAATPITPPSSKLIPTAKRTLILMFIVLIIGIGIISGHGKLGPLTVLLSQQTTAMSKAKPRCFLRKLMAMSKMCWSVILIMSKKDRC